MRRLKKFPIFLLSVWVVVSPYKYGWAQSNDPIFVWQQKYKEDPKQFLNVFNLAVSYQKANKYKEAIYYYRKAVKIESKLQPVAYYYLSKAYLSLDKKELAKKAIQQISIEKLPPNFKKKTIAFKNSLFVEEVLSQQQEDSFWGNLKLGYGFNSNPQFISADDTTDDVDSDSQLLALLNLKWQASKGSRHDFSLGYNGSSQSYGNNSQSNFTYHNLSAPLNFYWSQWRLQFSPSYSYQTFGGQAFSSIVTGAMEIKRKLSSSYLSLGTSFDSIDTLNDDYFYLTGQTIGAYLRWQKQWSKTFISSTYSFGDNQYQDSDTVSPSFIAHSINFYISQRFNSWAWSWSITGQTRAYSFDVTEDDTRKDQRFWSTLSLNYLFNAHWSLFLDLYTINNNSNFDATTSSDRNFNQFSATTGFNWVF